MLALQLLLLTSGVSVQLPMEAEATGTRITLGEIAEVTSDDAEALAHQRELEALEAQVPGIRLHLGYVSDEAFDRWIVAADTVVLPYRHIWSSSVAERPNPMWSGATARSPARAKWGISLR